MESVRFFTSTRLSRHELQPMVLRMVASRDVLSTLTLQPNFTHVQVKIAALRPFVYILGAFVAMSHGELPAFYKALGRRGSFWTASSRRPTAFPARGRLWTSEASPQNPPSVASQRRKHLSIRQDDLSNYPFLLYIHMYICTSIYMQCLVQLQTCCDRT